MYRACAKLSGMASETYAGVDGCRGGWLICLWTPEADRLAFTLAPDFQSVLAHTRAARYVAVDMPIGLPDTPADGARPCDTAARARLGPRASSVFRPPARSVLPYTDYTALRREVRGHGLSKQAFNLLPKIREVDTALTPHRQRRVCEAHPELAWFAATGAPMRHGKRTMAGAAERRTALRQYLPGALEALDAFLLERPAAAPANNPAANSAAVAATATPADAFALDDAYDAAILCRTAWRRAQGQAIRLPARPPRDQRGLRMEIWY